MKAAFVIRGIRSVSANVYDNAYGRTPGNVRSRGPSRGPPALLGCRGPALLPPSAPRVQPHPAALQRRPRLHCVATGAGADTRAMVWTLARLPWAQPALTSAVALGKLASEAGTTYLAIIGAKLLVSRQLRFQDAYLTVGLTMGGNILQLLEARWEIETERHFQAAMLPWMAARRARNLPHDTATFAALGKLTQERSLQWVEVAGLIGSLGSSLFAAIGNAHQLRGPLLAVLVGIAAVRHGIGAVWTQHIQQRVTDWTLQRTRASFDLLHAAGAHDATQVAANASLLAGNRAARLRLKSAGIGVESVQEALLLGAGYGMFWHLGWFDPQASLDTLVAARAGMVAARALVSSILTMHNRVETYLRAEPD